MIWERINRGTYHLEWEEVSHFGCFQSCRSQLVLNWDLDRSVQTKQRVVLWSLWSRVRIDHYRCLSRPAEQPFKALQWVARANIWLQSVLEIDVQNSAVQFRACAAQICSWGEMPIVWQWESFCAPDTKGLSMCSSCSSSSRSLSRNSKSTRSRSRATTKETPKGCQWSPVNGGNDNHEWGMALLVSPRFGSLVLPNFYSEK